MAWISVDQRLIGKKLRNLHKTLGCSRNEAIGILIGLWLWGLDNAESDGLLTSADREDVMGVIENGMSEDLDAGIVLDSLIITGWIDRDDAGMRIHDWGEWRAYYNRFMQDKKSRAERNQRYREKRIRSNEIESVTKDVSQDVTKDVFTEPEGKEEDPKPKKQSQKKSQIEKYGPEFEEFWSAYPRHDEKAEAFNKFGARINNGFKAEDLIRAARAYADRCRREHTETRYIKQAKTFLGPNLAFQDYLPEQREPSPVQTGNGSNPFRRS